MSRYRVGLIQNESEMLRQAQADIRPMIAHLEYHWIHYTIETLPTLFSDIRLRHIDALVIATNALNDKNLLAEFHRDENRALLADFLRDGGGLFLSLQRKLADAGSYGFLPEDLDICCHSRPAKETGNDGHLAIPRSVTNHILLNSPLSISADDTLSQCLSNEFVRNLYIAYLSPKQPKAYETLMHDDTHSPPRALLIVSRGNHPCRIVASAIPLDWQGHQHLLDNVIRFVVEGYPHIAVIKRDGTDCPDFQYLIANLEVTKVAFTQYKQKELDLSKLPTQLHTTFVIDPGFKEKDLVNAGLHQFAKRFFHGESIVYFTFLGDQAPIINFIGGRTSQHGLLPQAASWIRSVYKNGQWGNSFWQTVDVLETFNALRLSFKEYEEGVIDAIKPKKRGGSYDEVMGASCALLKVYSMFGQKNEFIQTLKWIKEKYPSVSLFEKASALDCLVQVGVDVSAEEREWFRVEARKQNVVSDNEMRIYRFAKTLFSCEYYDDCVDLCQAFKKTQTALGAWVNVSRTSSIVTLLVMIRRSVGAKASSLDEMIFRGITYIKSSYDRTNGNWNNDASATAKAICAVCLFEETLKIPVDDVILNLHHHGSEIHTVRLIEHIAGRNAELTKETFQLKNELEVAARERQHARSSALLAGVFLAVLFTIFLYCIVQFNDVDRITLLWHRFTGFLSLCSFDIFSWIVVIPWIVLYVFLRSYNVIPKFSFEFFRQWEHLVSAIKARMKR